MFDFIETMSGKVPEEIIDMFVNASEFHNGDPWAALRSCMIEYATKNNSAQFDYGAMLAEERFLFEKVVKFQEFFDDMHFEEDSIVGDYIKVKYGEGKGSFVNDTIPIPHAIKYFDPQQYTYHVKSCSDMAAWGEYNFAENSLTLREDVLEDDAVLLHEMIHMHEHALQKVPRYYHEILLLALYNDLKPQIEDEGGDLDQLIFGHSNIAEAQHITQIGGEHGILFYLKSLDLDLKMGYDLGTVCGYGRKQK